MTSSPGPGGPASGGRTGPVVIGVDSSTQSTKAAVVDVDSGALLALGRAPHTVTGTDGARRTDPELWWRALASAVADGLRSAGVPARAVSGIAVAGQQHGLVVLDRAGRPLHDALLWNDTGSAPQARALTEELGADGWLARTGVLPVASMTATKWQWLREHEPRVAEAAAAVRLPHDFLTERLCGTAVTDPGDASGTCWYSTADGGYDPVLLELTGMDEKLLSPVAPGGGDRAGVLTAAAAAELGLPAGIPVAVGTGDNMAAAVGLGLGRAGLLDHPVVSLGTSGTVFAASRTRPAVPEVAGFASADGAYLPLGCTLNCTLAVDKVAQLLGLDRERAELGGGPVLLPYLDGERTPDLPHATGLLTGLRHATTSGQLLGAAYEGAVFTVLRALDALLAACRLDPAAQDTAALPLRLVGGGARGRTWVETVRRLSGRPLVLPEATELVALGAAALAGSAVSGTDPVTVATSWNLGRGRELPPLERDMETWRRIDSVLDAAAGPLLG
ncbi:xylulokinase [Streptomyces boluensis]|uniref:Xylulose kinase n=1 Tax=Streptomyces boluensis TaxID=1775135 RepID=A0A964V0W8_9ACTN|nr:xylulokinase [Streptomyces boluensis]NBE55080.1 xylulokinase [Streptomyces boluensis]